WYYRTARNGKLVDDGQGEVVRGLSPETFLDVFPKLRALPESLQQNAFACFDNQQPSKGSVNFRDFCHALALCCRGSHYERLCFLFDLFSEGEKHHGKFEESLADESEDKAFLSPEALMRLVAYCKASAAPNEMRDGREMKLQAFFSWGEVHLSEDELDAALQPFYLLPSPQWEREQALEHLVPWVKKEGEDVFLVAVSWWLSWCAYVGLGTGHLSVERAKDLCLHHPQSEGDTVDENSSSGGGANANGAMAGASSRVLNRRPHELDNSSLQGKEGWEVREGLEEGRDYVVVPEGLWGMLMHSYCGGPAFRRRVVRARAEGAAAASGAAEAGHVRVDPYPLGLTVSVCGASGHPLDQEYLLLTSKYSTAGQTIRDALSSDPSTDMLHGLPLLVLLPTRHASGCCKGKIPQSLRARCRTPQGTVLCAHVHVNLLAMLSQCIRTVPLSPEARRAAVSCVPPIGVYRLGRTSDACKNPARWMLVPESYGDKPICKLSQVEVGSLKLLLEIQAADGTWPRARHIEAPEFRSFKVGQKLDAMDYQGRWYPGSIAAVETGLQRRADADAKFSQGNGVVGEAMGGGLLQKKDPMRVRVHFDCFAAQWDEWYDSNSLRLAPSGCHKPQASAAPANSQLPCMHSDEDEDLTASSRSEATTNTTSSGATGIPNNAVSRYRYTQSGRGLKLAPGVAPTASTTGENSSHSLAHPVESGAVTTVTLSKRAHTTGTPLVPGGCGLVNLGNSCYMNSAVQCLSHTPLLRSYLLSGQYKADINLTNVLGSQGKLVEAVAELLHQLWSQEYVCVFPLKFKQGLGKAKAMFAGSEQQDSQEFLAEILDTLHEDVNLVVKKPYVAAPDDTELVDLSQEERSVGAWERHLMRNRSVIVDLFQGQLRMEVRCPHCGKTTAPPFFDPFMYLSVPIPVCDDKVVFVIVLPRVRVPGRTKGKGGPLQPRRYGLQLSRLGEIGDLMAALTQLCGIPRERLVIADIFKSQCHKVGEGGGGWLKKRLLRGRMKPSCVIRCANLIHCQTCVTSFHGSAQVFGDPEEPLSTIQEDDYLVAYEKVRHMERRVVEVQKVSQSNTNHHLLKFAAGTVRSSAIGRTPAASTAQVKCTNRPPAMLSNRQGAPDAAATGRGSEAGSAASAEAVTFEVIEDEDSVMEEGAGPDAPSMAGFPRELTGLQPKYRLDALDNRGNWYTGTVEMVKDEMAGRRKERKVLIHFDRFTAKWDEWFSEKEWREGRLAQLYTQVPRKTRLAEIPLVQRKTVKLPTVNGSSCYSNSGITKELFGLPLLIHCRSSHSTCYLWRLIVQQASRFIGNAELAAVAASGGKGMSTRALLDALPFRVMIINAHAPLSSKDNCTLIPDGLRSIAAVMSPRMMISLDWVDAESDYSNALESTEDHLSYTRLQKRSAGDGQKGISLQKCLEAYTKEDALDENSWYCSQCKEHRAGITKIVLWKLPDILVIHIKRFQSSARWREKLRSLVVFPQSGLDMAEFVSKGSAQRDAMGQGGLTYDLFGVVNHMGGMTGGHYTACCRASPASKDGEEEVGCWDMRQPWLYFDDEYVEGIAPDKIVTEAAYVLFYRLRRLTPANVINLSN
ncbi:unnamed protein product, partial [Chrysoparadoxa australica]